MTEETQEQQGTAIAVFPTPQGIGLVLRSPDGDEQVAVLSPDDAGRVAMSLITTSVVFQMNEYARAAAEQAEVEKIRQMINDPHAFAPKKNS